jgi:hypothetical protein
MNSEVKENTKKEFEWIFIFLSSTIGFLLLAFHDVTYKNLNFWDAFPSHESVGVLLVLGSLIYTITKKFDYSLPNWLKTKNKNKIVGRIINEIISKK